MTDDPFARAWVPAGLPKVLSSGLEPIFDVLTPAERLQAPYNAICELLINGTQIGTGWLVHDSVVVTAAHIFQYSTACNLRFAGGGELSSRGVHTLRGSYSSDLDGSLDDLACVLCDDIPQSIKPLPWIETFQSNEAWVAGTMSDNSVGWSPGAAVATGGFIAFHGDTPDLGGFSGAPLFAKGQVVGVFLGNAGPTRRLAAPAERVILEKYRNVALALKGRSANFIAQMIAEVSA
jgi:hypothetical protein